MMNFDFSWDWAGLLITAGVFAFTCYTLGYVVASSRVRDRAWKSAEAAIKTAKEAQDRAEAVMFRYQERMGEEHHVRPRRRESWYV